MPRQPPGVIEVGVDIGGTFTDVVCRMPAGELRVFKLATTRANPSEAVRQALGHLLDDGGLQPAEITRFVHGTTTATNAVLERKGAKIGLLTTAGFEDVLELGRQFRRDMYDLDLKPDAPVFLAPGHRRFGVPERIAADGSIVTPLDEAALRQRVAELVAEGVEAVAVAFLFSFVNPVHERRAAELIAAQAPELAVSLSSEVDPAFREYERTCVTAFDAYIKPVLRRYLEAMGQDLEAAGVPAPLQIMQSRGGLARAESAAERPVRLFLSGPAAGVIGGSAAGRAAGAHDLITVDIGGTSSDIALVSQGRPVIRSEGLIDGYTVRVPMVDVNAIGAGGGSIAWIDAGGGLRVGPRSAGSEPGPACYGQGGEEATVTDASLVLGYIDPGYFAGGALALVPERARAAIQDQVAAALGLSVEAAALGVHRVVNAGMAEGIRLVSVRRGIDPRGFTLLALGGAGPLHATALAAELGMTRVVVPRHPGVLSAEGLLLAPIEHERAQAFHRTLQDVEIGELRAVLARLDDRCTALMAAEGVAASEVRIGHFADVCYIGQSYYLEIPVSAEDPDSDGEALDQVYRGFLEAHDRVYGHSVEDPVRIANLRSVHQAGGHPEGFQNRAYVPSGAEPCKGARPIHVTGAQGPVTATIWERAALAAGAVIVGPAIIEQADTTTLIEPGWQARVAPDGSLILTPNAS